MIPERDSRENRLTRPMKEKPTRLEIQIHPSDIKRGVKYLFLTRLQLIGWGAVVLLWLAFVGVGAALAPDVIGGILRHREYRTLEASRARLGERLEGLEGRLDRLIERGEQLQLRMNKIYLAYGLTNDASIGQGGYPEAATPIVELPPTSPWRPQLEQASEAEARLREQVRVLEAFLDEIQSFEEAHLDQVSSTPSVSPLRGDSFRLTSPFGTRRSPFTKKVDFHAGIDLAALTGTAVYAPADGTVSFAGRYPLRRSVAWWRYGNLISLRHGDRFITLYGHLDEISVRQGQRVRQGDLIGTVGNSGWSTNPHLHYEVRRLDEEGEFRPVDPRIYMLDHRWTDEEQMLIRARSAPAADFEPLPRLIRR